MCLSLHCNATNTIVFCMVMVKKATISSKYNIFFVWEKFKKTVQSIALKKRRWRDFCTIFLLLMRLSKSVMKTFKTLKIFKRISWKSTILSICLGFIKQMFIVFVLALLSFGGSLAIKYISMNYQPYIFRSTLSDLNHDEFHYSAFISSMKRCNETCNTVGDRLVEYVFLVKWKTWTWEYLTWSKG